MRNETRILLLAGILIGFPAMSHSSDFEITAYSFGGGGASASARFVVGGTVGSPHADQPLVGGSWSLTGGGALEGNPCVSSSADGTTDLADYRRFEQCLSGAGQSIATGCACFDLDGNSAIELRDFSLFQAEFSAP